MELLPLISHNIISFVLILSVIVFIHEFGHYFVARRCGVKIDEFAIGFGKELFGFNDKNGTRWKFCLLPFGGYVKMFGDQNPASIANLDKVSNMSEAEKKISFYHQNVFKRMAIVLAGPLANFILAILLFTILFKIQGQSTLLPVIDRVIENSAAAKAGLKSQDKILKIDGEEITDFVQIQKTIHKNPTKNFEILILREGQEISFKLQPKIDVTKDLFGNEIKIPMIGVTSSTLEYKKLNIFDSFIKANQETYNLSLAILGSIKDLIVGKVSLKELGGPVKIAEYSGKSTSMGLVVTLWFMAMISINLGVLNLLPIPILDGGHFFYYLIEAIKGKPLPERIQQLGFQFGFAVVLSLMVFTTFNDITNLFN